MLGGRRRRVPDLAVVVHDQDDVGGVLDQGAEVRLVALADHLLAEHDPLDREGHLVREDLQRRGQVGEGALLAEHREHPDRADRPTAGP